MSAFILPTGVDLDMETAKVCVRWLESAFWSTVEPVMGAAAIFASLALLIYAERTLAVPLAAYLAIVGIHQFLALSSGKYNWRFAASLVSHVTWATLLGAVLWRYPVALVLFSLAVFSMAATVHLRTHGCK